MGDASLMQVAQDIEEKAINAEHEEYRRAAYTGGASQGPLYVPREPTERKYRGTITPLFEPFTRMPEPRSYDAPIQALENAMQQLSSGQQPTDPINGTPLRANPDLGHVDSAGTNLENWTGEAADNFTRNFLDKFPYIAKNQFLLLGVMKGALEADQERWEKASRDIKDLAERIKAGLDNNFSSGLNELQFAFLVGSAVAAIGSLPFTGGASAAMLPAIGAASAVGKAGVARERAQFTKPGGSAERIVQSMKEAIDKLTQDIQNSGRKVEHALNGIPPQLQGAKTDFISPRPALAGMGSGETTGEEGLGRAD